MAVHVLEESGETRRSLPMVWLVIIRIGGTSFSSPSGGFCVTGDSGMTAIVREKLKCSRRESKRPARRKGKEMGSGGRREKEREKRQSRALVWGSRRLIHVSKWDRRSPRPPIYSSRSPGLIPWYRMLRGSSRLLFLESRGPPFRHLSRIQMWTYISNNFERCFVCSFNYSSKLIVLINGNDLNSFTFLLHMLFDARRRIPNRTTRSESKY